MNAAALESDKLEAEALLSVLGGRVRALRGHRGVTRKKLAALSRVSERYLAQLEQGRGNISVALLARVARVCGNVRRGAGAARQPTPGSQQETSRG